MTGIVRVGGQSYRVTSDGWVPADAATAAALDAAQARMAPVSPNGDVLVAVPNGTSPEVVALPTARGSIAAADVRPINVRWLWRDHIPFGMPTVLAGPPGVGKSTINYDRAARVSRQGMSVLILTGEDHLAAVVRPRLEAHDAALDRVQIVTMPIELPADIPKLRRMIEEHGARFVIIDPLVAFIGDDVNTHRDHHVRRVLAPLGEMAEATDAALVVVIHTNKGTVGDPLMRISGSVGFTGAARSVLVAAKDPNDDARLILAVAKSNLARFPTPQSYVIEDATVADDIHTSRVRWTGDAADIDVRELLAVSDRRETKADMARAFLSGSGISTTARPAAEIQDAGEAIGLDVRTLQRARQALRVDAWQDGFHGGWWWGPRPTPDTDDKHTRHDTVSPVSSVALPAETLDTPDTGDRRQRPGGDAA